MQFSRIRLSYRLHRKFSQVSDDLQFTWIDKSIVTYQYLKGSMAIELAFPLTFPVWLSDTAYAEIPVLFHRRFLTISISLLEFHSMRIYSFLCRLTCSNATSLLQGYVVPVILTTIGISDPSSSHDTFRFAYSIKFRLPSLKDEVSHVHLITICKHAISPNPGSPVWCFSPFLPIQWQDSHRLESLSNCISLTRLACSLTLRPVYCFKELQP